MSLENAAEFELDEDQHTGTIRLPNYHLVVKLDKPTNKTSQTDHNQTRIETIEYSGTNTKLVREIANALLKIDGIEDAEKRGVLYHDFSELAKNALTKVRSPDVKVDVLNIVQAAAKYGLLQEVCDNGPYFANDPKNDPKTEGELRILSEKAKRYYGKDSEDSTTGPDLGIVSDDRRVLLRKELHKKITRTHNVSELRNLCYLYLGFDYDELGEKGKSGNAREMIAKMERSRKLRVLIDSLRERHPTIEWPDPWY